MEQTRGTRLSISEQATLLLDDPAAKAKNKRLELFTNMEGAILESLGAAPDLPAEAQDVIENTGTAPAAYVVASRLSRANYEDSAKRESMMAALNSLRNNDRKPGLSGRVIRAK